MRGIRQTTPTRLIGFDFDEPRFDFQDLLDSALVGVGVGVGVVVGEAEAHVGRRWVEEEDVEAVQLERGHVHTVMCQGLRDPGSRQGSGQTLESSDSGPGFRESGTAGGCSAQGVLRGFRYSRKQKLAAMGIIRDMPGFRSVGVVRGCRGERQEEEAEQVHAVRREVMGHRPVVHPGAHGL